MNGKICESCFEVRVVFSLQGERELDSEGRVLQLFSQKSNSTSGLSPVDRYEIEYPPIRMG